MCLERVKYLVEPTFRQEWSLIKSDSWIQFWKLLFFYLSGSNQQTLDREVFLLLSSPANQLFQPKARDAYLCFTQFRPLEASDFSILSV